jgi:hypothetical protein
MKEGSAKDAAHIYIQAIGQSSQIHPRRQIGAEGKRSQSYAQLSLTEAQIRAG